MKECLHSKPGGVWRELGNGARRRVRSFGEDLMVMEVRFDKGGVGVTHRHAHRQLTCCLEGCFHFTVEGKLVVLEAGDTLLFHGNGEHGCVAQTAGLLLDVFTPLRADILKDEGLR